MTLTRIIYMYSWDRFAIVCVVHPIMAELFLTVQRRVSSSNFPQGAESESEREHHALRSIANSSNLENMMVMQRRMMLGAMRDPIASTLAIVVNGMEEAIVRCTMVYRDQLWDWAIGKPEPTEAEVKRIRLVQAASAANGMRIEVTAIITSR